MRHLDDEDFYDCVPVEGQLILGLQDSFDFVQKMILDVVNELPHFQYTRFDRLLLGVHKELDSIMVCESVNDLDSSQNHLQEMSYAGNCI